MNKILIANRGEIAVRIIRACKEMNIKTVAVYSEIDKDAMHTKLADEAICIGPASSNKSYLNFKNIIEAAHITGADGIHPGFGFLSENSQFAKICEESNIKFIGPKYQVIELLGNKSNAKKLMESAGVPVIPGSKGSVTGLTDAIKTAEKIGYPVMLKAAAGGGGKGCGQAGDGQSGHLRLRSGRAARKLRRGAHGVFRHALFPDGSLPEKDPARASSGDGSTGRGPTVTAPGQGDPRGGLPGPGNKGLRCYAYPRDPWVPSAPAEPGGRGGFFSLQLSPGNVPGNSNRAAGEAGGDRGWGISLPLAKSAPHYAAGGTRSPKWPYAGKALALS